MTIENPILRSDQSQAARILLHVSMKTLGLKSGLGTEIVDEFEQGRHDLEPEQQEQLREALEELGAEFIPEDENNGYGVRRRHNARKINSLNRWEGEGGPGF